MKSKNFLLNFNEALLGLVKSNKTNPCFLSMREIFAGSTKIDLFPKETKDIDDLIDNLLEVLETLSDIFNKPHIQTTTAEYVSRSELVSNINNDDFLKTVKDASLWKQKGSEMVPEYIYSKEFIDTIDNYDNRFIIFVFKEIISLLQDFAELQLMNANSIKNYYDSSEVTLSKLSIFREINKDKEELSNYIYKIGKTSKNFEKLQKIHKKVTRLKAHRFYQELKDTFIRIPISMTNILIHDRRYNKIYRFYKDFLFVKDDLTNIEDVYQNYVITRLLEYVYNQNKTACRSIKLDFDDKTKTYNLKDLVFEDKLMKYIFNTKENGLEIKAVYKDSEMTTLISTKYVINKNDVIDIDENYNNNFYLTYNNMSDSFDNIGVISHFKNMHPSLEFENIFESMHMILSFNESDSINKCPVCGQENLALKHKDIKCLKCRSTYSFIEDEGEQKVWIKNLWRTKK